MAFSEAQRSKMVEPRSCATKTQRIFPRSFKKYVLRTKMDNAE